MHFVDSYLLACLMHVPSLHSDVSKVFSASRMQPLHARVHLTRASEDDAEKRDIEAYVAKLKQTSVDDESVAYSRNESLLSTPNETQHRTSLIDEKAQAAFEGTDPLAARQRYVSIQSNYSDTTASSWQGASYVEGLGSKLSMTRDVSSSQKSEDSHAAVAQPQASPVDQSFPLDDLDDDRYNAARQSEVQTVTSPGRSSTRSSRSSLKADTLRVGLSSRSSIDSSTGIHASLFSRRLSSTRRGSLPEGTASYSTSVLETMSPAVPVQPAVLVSASSREFFTRRVSGDRDRVLPSPPQPYTPQFSVQAAVVDSDNGSQNMSRHSSVAEEVEEHHHSSGDDVRTAMLSFFDSFIVFAL